MDEEYQVEYEKEELRKKPPVKNNNSMATMLAVIMIFALGFASFFIVRQKRLDYASELFARSPYYTECKKSELDNVSDVRYFAGNLAVYVERSSGNQGLIRLDGNKITDASYTDFASIENGWHNTIYIAYPVGESYPKFVKISEEKVDIKQYQGGTPESGTVLWSKATDSLALHDSTGYVGDLTPEEVKLDDGIYAVTDGKKYGYVNEWLECVIDLKFDYALDFSDGFGAFCKGEKWGYVSEDGDEKLPPVFTSTGDLTVEKQNTVFEFRQGLCPVKKDGVMGVIDKEGKTVIDFEYDAIIQGYNGKFIAKRGGVWYVLDLGTVPENETVEFTDADSSSRLKPGEYYISTNGSALNLRSSASQTSEVLAKIPNGTKVTVTKSAVGWAYIEYELSSGWVSSDFLSPAG